MSDFSYYLSIPIETVYGEQEISFAHSRSHGMANRQNGPYKSTAHELYMHVEGTCNILVGDRIFSPKRGDLFLYPANQSHNSIHQSDVYERFILFFCTNVFDAIGCQDPILDLFESNEASGNQILLPSESSQEIMRRLQRISDVIRTGASTAPYRLYSDTLRILIVIKEILERSTVVPMGTNCPKILNEVVTYIHLNYQNIQGLQEVCEYFGISRVYLSKIFERYTVVTPYHYIRELKLSHAKGLLSQGASVTEACFDSGFPDYSNFIRLFRKETGVTPHKYKKQHKEN